ncbi:MAG TPA: UbiA-like polyprenyltransferase [Candidatus Binatia bacterium]|jgi:4-hydroxybenzoate polyprenyltransferase
MTIGEKVANYARLVRFSHSVFALPFALASLTLAGTRYHVSAAALGWIVVAMVAARTAAMGFNRLADRKFDALNPRTREWELPAGKVGGLEAAFLTVAAACVFVYAAYRLNPLCFYLSPIALAVVFFYSLTKRFTWTSHLFLGLALSLAPIGAWLAVSGAPRELGDMQIPGLMALAVVFWLAGFDIIYAIQDYSFDRAQGLFSIPARFGVAKSLAISSVFHLATIILLALVGLSAELGAVYWIGIAAVAAILIWEHRLVSPHDLSRINKAFFDVNAYVSLGYLAATAIDVFIRGFAR